ncbi:MAG: 50S ribosomal protein L9, partial [Lachnospiraceae bacterium]|nr:50S ribosomal protein L9 [Lachnospiraceae bacterium]
KAGKEGKLFGSVTAGNVADAISSQLGIECEKKKVALESEIKAFGTFSATVKFMQGISQKVTVHVREEE